MILNSKLDATKLLLSQFNHLMEPMSYSADGGKGNTVGNTQLTEDQIAIANKLNKKSNMYLFDVYTPQKIAIKLEKVFLLELENAFQQFPNQKMGLLEFITCFLSVVKHKKSH